MRIALAALLILPLSGCLVIVGVGSSTTITLDNASTIVAADNTEGWDEIQ